MYWLEERNLSLRAVAETAGVSYEQLKKIKQFPQRSINFDDGVKVARALHLSLDQFLACQAASNRDAIIQALETLSPEARAALAASLKRQLEDQSR